MVNRAEAANTLMRRKRPACCARAVNGHVAATPARSNINSRRLICCPEPQERHHINLRQRSGSARAWEGPCSLWVIIGHLHRNGPCPLYPRKRTCAVQLAMSAMGHKRTSLLVHRIRIAALKSPGFAGAFVGVRSRKRLKAKLHAKYRAQLLDGVGLRQKC